MSSPSPPSPSFTVESFTDLSEAGLASPFSAYEGLNPAVIVPSLSSALGPWGNKDNSSPLDETQILSSSARNTAREEEEDELRALGAKSEHFFFAPDMLTFVAEKTVYRVHAYLFTMCSPYWSKKLTHEPRTCPIHLDDVTMAEMDAFLSSQYPSTTGLRATRSSADWIAILRLATMWQFEASRRLAITALDSSLESPLDRLVLARAHDVEAWLHPAFVALCMRPEPLIPDEARRLALDDVLTVMTVRERLLKGNGATTPSQQIVSEYVENFIRTSVKLPETAGVTLSLSVPPTAAELATLSRLLFVGSYHDVVATLNNDNIETFCRLLADFSSTLKESTRFDPILQSVLHRGALDPSFIPIGTRFFTILPAVLLDLKASYPTRMFVDEQSIRNLLKLNAGLLRRVWRACADSIDRFGSFDLALRHTLSIAHPAYIRPDFEAIVGKCGDLERSVTLYKERCANLRAFLASLTDAGLIPRS